MKLSIMCDGGDLYLASEETGEKVENLMVTETLVTTNNRFGYNLGSPYGVINPGLHEITLKGSFSEVSITYKEPIYVIARDYRDFKSFCEQNNIVPSKKNGFGKVVEILKADSLRGYRSRHYHITPQAIHNEEFNEIIEVLKTCKY